MALPMFFHEGVLQEHAEFLLNEDTAKHVVQVLRMQVNSVFCLTDGKGTTANVSVTDIGKKKCSVKVISVTFHKERINRLHLGIAFTKNTARNEWLLEKATELGVSSIIPLMTQRTERERIKAERWRNILVSALIQSQQYYLPLFHEPTHLETLLENLGSLPQKLIAHCIAEMPRVPLARQMKPGMETLLLIGPEGDFTKEEADLCMQHACVGVQMGSQRLRTETAAITACAFFNLINYEA